MASDTNHRIELDSMSKDEDGISDLSKKESILTILEQSSASYDVNDIIEVLGGAEQILRDYLSSQDILLNTTQLTKIEKIISATPRDTSLEDTNDSQSVTYTFNKNDTLYHEWFDSQVASCIVQIIRCKWSVIASILISAISMVWRIGEVNLNSAEAVSTIYLSYALIASICVMVHIISFILTINRKVFKRSITHFVFWFKILTSIQSLLLVIILRLTVIRTSRKLIFVNDILFQVLILFITILYSAIDGFQLSRRINIMMGLATSIIYSYFAIAGSLFSVRHGLESTVIISSSIKFSIASLYASSMRVLCVFLWKQTILLIIKKDKCINIRHSPYIKWIDK